jgi:WD40-like Beta Propeller Repeat
VKIWSMPPRTLPALRAAIGHAVTRTLALCGVLATAVAGWAPSAGAAEAKKLCTIKDARIVESSGLAASRRHPGIVYTFNDSGGTPRLFAIGPDCRTKATLTFGGAQNRDWEAMAVGTDGLYVGDIGDNQDGAWPYVTVYRIPEPVHLRSQTLHATAYRIKYADGPRNAETMMIDPRGNRLYIASKEFGGSLYEGPKKLRTGGFNVMHKVGGAPFYATDGAFSPDGRTFVIRGYWNATIYSRPDQKLTDVSIPTQDQGEGIAFTPDGRSLLVSSEGADQPIWQVPVPAEALPKTSKTHGTAGAPAKDAGGEPKKTSPVVLLLIAGVIVLAGAAMFARRRGS